MKVLRGIGASPGVACAPVFRVEERKGELRRHTLGEETLDAEKARFAQAVAEAERQLTAIVERLRLDGLESEAGILEGQLMLLADPQLTDDVRAQIDTAFVNAEWAVAEAFGVYAALLEQMDDDYMRERVNDLYDLKGRLIDIMQGVASHPLAGLDEPSIVVAHDLTPSVTSQMDRRLVLGIATEIGSGTSHSSILARTMGIPAVVGCAGLLRAVVSGDAVALDGDAGTIAVHPDERTLRAFREKRAAMEQAAAADRALLEQAAATADGVRIELLCNIGRPSDAPFVHEHGGEGVGLFRSEFLFMERDALPDEEEQYAAYRATVDALQGKPLVIRTLDIGGDKSLEYLKFPAELNPFLGWRAIRYCLANPELFRTQLRAILRAGAHGPVSVMFPMVSGLPELAAAKEQLKLAQEELLARGVPFGESMPVGIMIEVPSAALIADRLAPHVDFFSIGTNDLIQYTIAVDRMNEQVSALYEPEHVAVLRLIKFVCDAAGRCGKAVSVCGEMAGDPASAETLVGLGVTKLSMSPPLVPKVKRALLDVHRAEADRRIAEKWQ